MLNRILILGLGTFAWNAWASPPPPPVRVIQVYPKAELGVGGEKERSHVTVVPAPPAALPEPAVQQAMVAVPAKPVPVESQDGVEQALRDRQDFERAHAGMNSLNPLSSEYQSPSAQQVPPEFREKFEQLQALLNNPAIQGYLKVMSDKEIQEGAKGVMASPDLKKLGFCQLGFLVVFLFARSMWMARATTWIKRLWVSLSSGIVYVGCASVGIPLFVLGNSYMRLLHGVWRFVQKQL